jgi:hypothetical protein
VTDRTTLPSSIHHTAEWCLYYNGMCVHNKLHSYLPSSMIILPRHHLHIDSSRTFQGSQIVHECLHTFRSRPALASKCIIFHCWPLHSLDPRKKILVRLRYTSAHEVCSNFQKLFKALQTQSQIMRGNSSQYHFNSHREHRHFQTLVRNLACA